MRTWVLVGLLLGTVSILTACSGSGSPLSVTPEGATARQSHPDNAYKILHKFGVTSGDGIRPAAQLINVKGTLYGTTSRGGVGGVGTVFSISPSGNETVIHSFGTDGAYPVAALLYVNGTFYGTTSLGGALGGGTIFSMTPAGKVKVLHKFTADYPDQKNTGSVPEAGLIDVNGTLYGTASQGGRHSCNNGYTGCGTVFSITPNGKYTLLHSFGGRNDGIFPQAGLLDVNGTLYGTTSQGGERTTGIIFSITPAGQYQVIYNFGGTNASDGQSPQSNLIDVNGTLYGTTSSGGEHGSGTVFGVTMEGVETLWYSFAGSNGSQPLAPLTNVKGVLYGTTAMGGVNNVGTVFGVTTDGTEKVLHSFSNATGKNPVAGLLQLDGTLYGTTYGVEARPHGNVFSLTP